MIRFHLFLCYAQVQTVCTIFIFATDGLYMYDIFSSIRCTDGLYDIFCSIRRIDIVRKIRGPTDTIRCTDSPYDPLAVSQTGGNPKPI